MSRYYPPVTVTGNPVNFSAPNGGKLDSVSVQIIPTQDLHGYANPWPAGGGINKAKLVYKTVSASAGYRNLQDNSVTVYSSNTAAGYRYAQFALFDAEGYAGQTLTFTAKAQRVTGSSTPRILGRLYDSNNSAVGSAIFEKTGTSITHTFTLPATIDSGVTFRVSLYCNSGSAEATETNFYDIQVEVGSTAHDFSPYSNICPISGRTGLSVYVSPTTAQADATTYAVDWTSEAGTVYGGTLDVVTGLLTVNMGNIPSYNGETINEPWLSSMDAYAEGTTPTIGAQVVYTLADPAVYQLGHKFLTVLSGENYVWASNNETISVVYALLVPGSEKYTLVVNGADIADFVERDSYRTTLYPVFSEAVQTLDGVGHTALLRKKGELSARFNPRTAADTAIICAALLNAPCEVQYHCLQRNADVTALMTIDSVSALYLSRCLYCGQKWNDIDSITLTEL